MNRHYYKHIPCGDTIPLNNPHAFSVSMPTIRDVIDYEEGSDSSKEKIKSAYPRIVIHPYIYEICKYAAKDLGIVSKNLFLIPTLSSAKIVANLSGTTPAFYHFKGYIIVSFPETGNHDAKKYFSFMKHCGYMIFSREAEDLLRVLGYNIEVYKEEIEADKPEEVIKDILKEGYGDSDIILANCGMNSIYIGFNEVKKVALRKGRNLFILFGWAYADTIEIFKKCTNEYIIIPDVCNIHELKLLLKERGSEVAAVYLESVSNPLIAVPDIPEISKLATKYGFYFLIDNTFATPWNVDISSYGDMIFESLTKFASGQGDLMAGATIIPADSKLDRKIIAHIKLGSIPLYIRDKKRLAHSIKGYKERIREITINSFEIEKALLSYPNIKKIYSVNSPDSIKNWKKISRGKVTCGVISLLFYGNIEEHYDNISLPKGPSLGTEFPLLMAYTLLAHYDELKNSDGRRGLNKIGLHPDLMRLSIGTDDPELTLNSIKEHLTCVSQH